jgi:hypothetical protein
MPTGKIRHDQVLNILKSGFRIRIVLEPFHLSVDPDPDFDIKKIVKLGVQHFFIIFFFLSITLLSNL